MIMECLSDLGDSLSPIPLLALECMPGYFMLQLINFRSVSRSPLTRPSHVQIGINVL